MPPHLLLGLALGVLPIVCVSIRDDIKPMRPAPKFIAHLAGASAAVALGVSLNADIHLFGQTIQIGWLAAPLSVIWLVGTTNAFNIVDGLDGLAAGLGLIAACGLAGVFLLAGENAMAAAAFVVAGAIGGFLPYQHFSGADVSSATPAPRRSASASALLRCAAVRPCRPALPRCCRCSCSACRSPRPCISMTRRAVRRLERKEGGGMLRSRPQSHSSPLAGDGHRSSARRA